MQASHAAKGSFLKITTVISFTTELQSTARAVCASDSNQPLSFLLFAARPQSLHASNARHVAHMPRIHHSAVCHHSAPDILPAISRRNLACSAWSALNASTWPLGTPPCPAAASSARSPCASVASHHMRPLNPPSVRVGFADLRNNIGAGGSCTTTADAASHREVHDLVARRLVIIKADLRSTQSDVPSIAHQEGNQCHTEQGNRRPGSRCSRTTSVLHIKQQKVKNPP